MHRTPNSPYNSMAFWLPTLNELRTKATFLQQRASKSPDLSKVPDILIPETVLVHNPYGYDIDCDVTSEERYKPKWDQLCKAIGVAATNLGPYPHFLRTDQTSAKHDWKNSCYIESERDIPKHLKLFFERSEMEGAPVNFLAVRKLIPTEAIVTDAFRGKMSIAKEWRLFINDGQVVCDHPYWVRDAFIDRSDYGSDLSAPALLGLKNIQPGRDKDERPDAPPKEKLTITDKQLKELQTLSRDESADVKRIASFIAQKFDGWWSVDLLKGKDDKFWVIDMALGRTSYHVEGCKVFQELTAEM